jgi:hypothetical protein
MAHFTETDTKTAETPNIFTEVTVIQLFEFAWKCFFAGLMFATPFLLLFGMYVVFRK